MKKHQGDSVGGASVLLADRGERSRELGAVFQALANVRFADRSFTLLELGDVEDLLLERSGSGTLILESGRVPSEDIGFVRRFLERQPSWKLLVLGDDAKDGRARGLLGLPRSQWLPWPPDLDQMAALLGGAENGSVQYARESPPPLPKSARAKVGAGQNEVVVGDFLEELLAGFALSGAGAPRFLYRCDEPLRIAIDPGRLHEGLSGLFELARVCAGEAQVVDVTAEGSDDLIRIRIDFPLGPLTDADLPGLLEGTFEGTPELTEAVQTARQGAGVLQDMEALVDLLAQRPGRLRLEVLLPGRLPNAK